MTSVPGIVHSERTASEIRQREQCLEALQLWVALPEEDQQCEPFFTHYPESCLPVIETDTTKIRVMIGEAFGVKAPVKTHSPTLYVEVQLEREGRLPLPDHIEERVVYVVSCRAQINGTPLTQHKMAIFHQNPGIELEATEPCRLVIIGGTNLGKRTVWWNQVSSRKDLIEQAKQDWQDQKFPKVSGETEFIPLPE